MKKYVILLLVLMITGCKNAADEMSYEATEDVNEFAVAEDFDKVAFYEDYIKEKFEERVEEIKLAQKHPKLLNEEADSFFTLSYGVFKFKRLELKLLKDTQDWTPGSSYKINPEYSYNYRLTKVLSDSITKRESRLSFQVSIKENYKIIEGDSIPTVEIFWH